MIKTKGERNKYIDFLRGLAALSIIIIHTAFKSGTGYVPDWFKNITLLFDAPIFFYLSGWASSYSESNIKKVEKSILTIWQKWILFIILITIGLIILSVLQININTLELIGIKNFINNLMFAGEINTFPVIYGSMWFIPHYFIVIFINTIIIKIINNHNEDNLNIYLYTLVGIFIWIQFGNSFLGLDIRYFLFYSFFWVLGYTKKCKTKNLKQLSTVMILLLIGVLCSTYVQNLPLLDFQNAKFPPSLKYGFASLISIFIIKYFDEKYNKPKKFIEHIGKNAIYYFFAQGIGSSILYYLVDKININLWFIKFIIMVCINVIITITIAESMSYIYDYIKKQFSKDKIKKLKENLVQYIFIFIVIIGLFTAGILSLDNSLEINDYENRTAYKITKPTLENILNSEFQNNMDNALSDQLPKSILIKKIYNFGNSYITKYTTDLFVKKYCNNNYIGYSNGILTFDCDDTLVYNPVTYEDKKELIDTRVENINYVLDNVSVPTYIYYIEKDTDINFTNNSKTNLKDGVLNNINTDNIHVYETNSFEEFTNNFYKTDHHWNYKGSYQGYLELHDFLGLTDDVLKPIKEECTKSKFAGSKATISGAQYIYGENLCAYSYDYPKYTTYVNGYLSNDYGVNDINDLTDISYGNYYGWDNGETILDFNNPDKENILLIGESYDNALLKLIGSHYNKLYSVDLRHYTDEVGKEFKLNEYIKENEIDKVVLIGSYGFFAEDSFNIEV